MGNIYKITNKLNGKCYIGQTIYTAEHRFKFHVMTPKGAIGNAITKYGLVGFVLEVLHKDVADEMLSTLERQEIKNHNSMSPNGYNLTDGGEGNYKRSDESRAKMSAAQKGREHTEKTRAKMSKSHKGKKLSDAHKKKMSDAHTGKKRSAASRAKMSASQKRRKPHSAETRNKISNANKGKKRTSETRAKIAKAKIGNIPWNKGKQLSDESRAKMSEAAKRRKPFSAEIRKNMSDAQKKRSKKMKNSTQITMDFD